MEVKEQRHGNVTVLGLIGRLDSLTCRAFEGQLLGTLGDSSAVVVDCAGMEYISSAGLRVLLMAAKQARSAGGQLALATLQDNPREVFEISGFAAIFSIYPTLEEALAAVS